MRVCLGLARLGQVDCDDLENEELVTEIPLRREGSLAGSSRSASEYSSVAAQVMALHLMQKAAVVEESFYDVVEGYSRH